MRWNDWLIYGVDDAVGVTESLAGELVDGIALFDKLVNWMKKQKQ